MRLVELLTVCDENLVVCIWDAQDDHLIGEYNGRDSIDEMFNELTVVKILGSGKGNLIDVVIAKEG